MREGGKLIPRVGGGLIMAPIKLNTQTKWPVCIGKQQQYIVHIFQTNYNTPLHFIYVHT